MTVHKNLKVEFHKRSDPLMNTWTTAVALGVSKQCLWDTDTAAKKKKKNCYYYPTLQNAWFARKPLVAIMYLEIAVHRI